MPESPILNNTDLVTYTIIASGSVIPDTYLVEKISITHHANRIGRAEITLLDGSAAQESFTISDSGTFVPGNAIEIRLGYHATNTPLFTGIVTGTGIRIHEEGSRLTVTCHDAAIRMDVVPKTQTHPETRDSELISQTCSNYGIDASVSQTAVMQRDIAQENQTDWELIVDRARMNGMLIVTDSGKLRVTQPAIDGPAALKITYGMDLLRMSLEMNTLTQYQKVRASCIDTDGDAVSAGSREPGTNQQGNISGKKLARALDAGDMQIQLSTPCGKQFLQTRADAELLWSRLSRFTGTVTFQGSSKAEPNSVIELAGLGDRFNGKAFVSGVEHMVENGNWITMMTIGYPVNGEEK